MKNNGDDKSDSSSIFAFCCRKLIAKRIPILAFSHPCWNEVMGMVETELNFDWSVAKTTIALTSRPKSRVIQNSSHSSWNSSRSFNELFQREVICARARSDPRNLTPSEFTRTKISATSSYPMSLGRICMLYV